MKVSFHKTNLYLHSFLIKKTELQDLHVKQMCVTLIQPFNHLTDYHKFLGFCSGVGEVSVLLEHDATSLGKSLPTFQDNLVISSSRMAMCKKNNVEHFNP